MNIILLLKKLFPPSVPAKPTKVTGTLYRILTDPEFMGTSRTAAPGWKGNPSTPATCHFDVGQSQVRLSSAAQALVKKLNPKILNYVTGASNGWANAGKYPLVTPIGFENNYVDVISVDYTRGRAQIRTWNGEKDDSCVIHRWENINQKGGLFDAHNGIAGYIVLNYPSPCWVDLNRIKKI